MEGITNLDTVDEDLDTTRITEQGERVSVTVQDVVKELHRL